MNLEGRSQHAPRRTQSFDSYDNLDRLEERRRRRNEFFENRAKFSRDVRVPSTPPPAVPARCSSRSISPTSKLIQGFTDKLKEISTSSDSTDCEQPLAIPKRAPQGKIQVISLDSPRRISYKTTCHVFPTFKGPQEPGLPTKKVTEDDVTFRKTTQTRQRSFNSIDDILHRSPSRENSFKANGNSQQQSSNKDPDEGKSREVSFQTIPRAIRQRSFNSVDDILSSSLSRQTSFRAEHLRKQVTSRLLMAKPFRKPSYEYKLAGTGDEPDARVPVTEPPCVKRQVGPDGYNFATPFQDTVEIYRVASDRGECDRVNVEGSEERPVPSPRTKERIPQPFHAYRRQQSGKEWRPVEAPFSRTSHAYSSLPARSTHVDRSRYLTSTLTQSDLPGGAMTPTPREARRGSVGVPPEIKLRSKASNIPVKDLIQKFSKQ